MYWFHVWVGDRFLKKFVVGCIFNEKKEINIEKNIKDDSIAFCFTLQNVFREGRT